MLTVTPGNSYAIVVGAGGAVGSGVAGGAGGDTTFAATLVVAKGGAGGGLAAANNTCAAAGAGSATGGVGDAGQVFAGGSGSACASTSAPAGGAGGGGAGSTGAGGDASGNTAGLGTEAGGGNGGNGLTSRAAGNPGVAAGGGGGGGYATNNTDRSGGAGGAGMLVIMYAEAPIVSTSAATGLTRADAQLNGSVDDNGGSTVISFEYGLTTAYGNTVSADQSPLAAGSGSTTVSAIISGLTCNTTYHYRVKAENAAGVSYGSDLTLTTAPCVQVLVTASPAACSNVASIGTQPWSTLNGPLASDNVYATATLDDNQTSNFLQCTGYGFAIPAGATINGIRLNAERSASGSPVTDAAVRLVKGGVIQAGDRATTTRYPRTDAVEAHGSYNDLWGASWTIADINAGDFGVAFASIKAGTFGGARTVRVDYLPLTISYTPAIALDHVVISAPAAAVAPGQVGVSITPHTAAHIAITDAGTINLSTSSGTGDWAIGSGSGTLTPGPANSGQASYTFGSGESSVTLGFSSQSAGTVTLNVADAYGADLLQYTPAAEKANVIVFSGVSFALTSGACSAGVAIGTAGSCSEIAGAIAGQALNNVYVTAVDANRVPTYLSRMQNRQRTLRFGLSCVNPTANAGINAGFSATTAALPLCAANGAVPSSWTTGVTFTFLANTPSVGPFDFSYADVGKVVLWVNRDATSEMGSSAAFVVKPDHFDISNVVGTLGSVANPAAADASGAAFIKAGAAFSVTLKAMTATGAPTPNYGKEYPVAQGARLIPTLVAPAGGHNPGLTVASGNTVNDVIAGSEFGAGGQVSDPNGVATVTNLGWNEVGIIRLTAIADHAGANDYLDAGPVPGATTGTIGNIGRFQAAQFALSGAGIANRTGLGGSCAAPVGCDTFTYIGEALSALFTLSAKAADGTTTLQNYAAANGFAMLDPLAAVSPASGGPARLGAVDAASVRTPFPPCDAVPAHPCISPAQATAGTFVAGVAAVTLPFSVYRGNTAAGPYAALDVGIAPQDSDGALMAAYDLDTVNVIAGTNNHAKVGRTEVRYGRGRLANAHGSELLRLPVQVTAQYWSGSAYVNNTADNATSFAATAITFSNWQKLFPLSGWAAGATSVVTPPTTVVITNGAGSFLLEKPGAGMAGSVDIGIGAPAYLPSATSRATFGLYRGNDEFIDMREAF